MTFGEKLQRLRKEAGLSQEELAGQLHVSRQAVSKWERNESYPETEKLIRMGTLFGVTLDELLQETRELGKNAGSTEVTEEREEELSMVNRQVEGESSMVNGQVEEKPPTVNRQENESSQTECRESGKICLTVSLASAEDFLTLQKKKTERTAVAAGVMLGSLACSFLDADLGVILFLLCFIAGMVLVFSVRFMDDPYQRLWNVPLRLESEAWEKIRKEYEERKGRNTFWNLIGIILIAAGLLICPLLIPAEQEPFDTIVMGAGMILAGAGVYFCACVSGWRRAYQLLLFNENFHNRKGKRR